MPTLQFSDWGYLFVIAVVVGGALIASAFWKRYKITHWTKVTAHIDRIDLGQDRVAAARLVPEPSVVNEVVLEYTYHVNGEPFRGFHETGFTTRKEAVAFAARFKPGMPITIEYDPRNPAKTVVNLL